MKKLMIGMAMIAASSVLAAVESANIVGYGPTGLGTDGNGTCGGASFVPVSGATIDLLDITVTGYEDNGGAYGEVEAQTLDGTGASDISYFWFDMDDGENVYKGWYTADEFGALTAVVRGERVLAPGEGLWTLSGYDGLKLQSAGSVPTAADISTLLGTDGEGTVTANPTPVNIDLVDCYVTGYEDNGGAYGEVEAQTLDGTGASDISYFWFDMDDGENVYYGWYTADEFGALLAVERGDQVLTPGQGLWTLSGYAGLTFVWPKVDL